VRIGTDLYYPGRKQEAAMSSESTDRNSKPVITLVRAGLKTPRAAAIAGIMFSALFLTALVVFRLSIPSDLNEAGEWLPAHWKKVHLALQLLPFSAIAFLWFMGVMRDRMGELEDRFFSTVFLGSGFLFVAMLFCFSAVEGAVIMIYMKAPSAAMEPVIYSFGRLLAYNMINVYGIKMASVFMIMTSTLSLRTGIVPRWMALAGYPLALLLLFCSGFCMWFSMLFPLWVFILSVYILIVNLKRSSA